LIMNGIKNAILRVEDSATTAWCIGRGDGGNDYDRDSGPVSGDFCRVNRFSAAHADKYAHLIATDNVGQPVQFVFTALTLEWLDVNRVRGQIIAVFGKDFFFNRTGCQYQPVFTQQIDPMG